MAPLDQLPETARPPGRGGALVRRETKVSLREGSLQSSALFFCCIDCLTFYIFILFSVLFIFVTLFFVAGVRLFFFGFVV